MELKTKQQIGDIIRAARIKCGYTQQELGEKLGYEDRSALVSVQNWERGIRPVPLDKMRSLSLVLNLSLDDLIP